MLRTWFGWFRCGLEVVWWWFGANMAGQRNRYAFKFLLHLLILPQKHILCVKKVAWDGLKVVWGGLGWFGANMAGQRNKNAFKFLLQLLILSQKHILCVKKVVWDGLDVVLGGMEVVWGGLGWFGVFPRTPGIGVVEIYNFLGQIWNLILRSCYWDRTTWYKVKISWFGERKKFSIGSIPHNIHEVWPRQFGGGSSPPNKTPVDHSFGHIPFASLEGDKRPDKINQKPEILNILCPKQENNV